MEMSVRCLRFFVPCGRLGARMVLVRRASLTSRPVQRQPALSGRVLIMFQHFGPSIRVLGRGSTWGVPGTRSVRRAGKGLAMVMGGGGLPARSFGVVHPAPSMVLTQGDLILTDRSDESRPR